MASTSAGLKFDRPREAKGPSLCSESMVGSQVSGGQGGVGAVDVEGRGLADAQRAQRGVGAFMQLRGLQGARHPVAGGFAVNGEAPHGDLAAAEERLAVTVELGGVDGGDSSFFQRVEKGVDGGGGRVGVARHNRGGAEDEGKWLGHSSWGSAGGWLEVKWKSK